MTGQTLGHYQVLEKLGARGMGEVYKARDTHLNRMVAIKLLRADRMADAGRKQRFIQEAQAASSLNQPNIVVIHDITNQYGLDYMVIECVAGKTLDALIPRQGMRLADALNVGHPDGERADQGPCGRHRSSGSETFERDGFRGRAREAARFRIGQVDGNRAGQRRRVSACDTKSS